MASGILQPGELHCPKFPENIDQATQEFWKLADLKFQPWTLGMICSAHGQ